MTTVELALDDLRSRVERLERNIDKQQEEKSEQTPNDRPLDQTEVMAWLKAQGLIAELPPEAKAHAARWRALPEEDKQVILWELDHLSSGPMISDIVIENRLTFVSGDRTLLKAAQAEGLTVNNPFDRVSPDDQPHAAGDG